MTLDPLIGKALSKAEDAVEKSLIEQEIVEQEYLDEQQLADDIKAEADTENQQAKPSTPAVPPSQAANLRNARRIGEKV